MPGAEGRVIPDLSAVYRTESCVRGVVDFPAQYRWSSYRRNADGKGCTLVQPHAVYQRLGIDTAGRQQAYRGLFRQVRSTWALAEISAAFEGGQVFVDAAFHTYRGRRAAASELATTCERPGSVPSGLVVAPVGYYRLACLTPEPALDFSCVRAGRG